MAKKERKKAKPGDPEVKPAVIEKQPEGDEISFTEFVANRGKESTTLLAGLHMELKMAGKTTHTLAEFDRLLDEFKKK